MRNARVASRYAKALVSLAVERKDLDAVRQDVDFVLNTIKGSRDLRVLFNSPVVKPDTKQKILTEIFGKHIGELTLQFLMLLSKHRREANTQEILKRFVELYFKAKDIVTATLVTPIAMDAELRAEFEKMIKTIGNKQVEITEKVNPDIIGGFVVRVGDNQIDASIAGKIKRLKTEFKDNPYTSSM